MDELAFSVAYAQDRGVLPDMHPMGYEAVPRLLLDELHEQQSADVHACVGLEHAEQMFTLDGGC